jgi:CBS domain-containing protein
MNVEDVMTTAVVSVRGDTPLKTVAQELVAHRVSGLPVTDDEGRIVGVISEADLLVKTQALPRAPATRLARLRRRGPAEAERRLVARLAGDAMTTPPITIEPHRPVSAAARTMLAHRVHRLPVVREGRLIGIVTRGDLVGAFTRSDQWIASDVEDQVASFLAYENDDRVVRVSVREGEVRLTGRVRRELAARTLELLARDVPGVVHVDSRLTWVEDDSPPSKAPLEPTALGRVL